MPRKQQQQSQQSTLKLVGPPPESEINRLVRLAQLGNEEAKAEIYSKFEWYLFKYRQFFRSESDLIRLTKTYADVGAFFSLYAGKRTRGTISGRRWSAESADYFNRKANEIIELAKDIGLEDIDTIIDISFFECVRRYDPLAKVKTELAKQDIEYELLEKKLKKKYELRYPSVGFEGFLMAYFKYRLKKNLDAESKGVIPGIGWCKPISTPGYNSLSRDGIDTDELPNYAELESVDDASVLDIIADSIQIDQDWVEGTTCSFPYNLLSKQERWLFKAKFIDHRYAYEIAESIGVSPSVVRARLAEAKQILLSATTDKD